MSSSDNVAVTASARSGSVKYKVSDFLQDRHPYNPETGFMAQRERDEGKVFNGFLPEGIDTLLDEARIERSDIAASQKAVALKHLVALSAPPEKKIQLLRKGVVQLVAKLMRESSPPAQVEASCCQLLRSLCFVPQGCHEVVMRGGLGVLVDSLRKREDVAEREEARLAAAGALCQIARCWEGRNWMLDIFVPPDLELLGADPVEKPPLEQQDAMAQSVLDALVMVIENDRGCKPMLLSALTALAQLSSVERGLHMALIAGVLRGLQGVLDAYVNDDGWVRGGSRIDSEIILQTVTVIWHIGLDDVGKNQATEVPVVQYIGKIMSCVLVVSKGFFPLKAALAGAVSALMLHSPMKHAALEKLEYVQGENCLVDILLLLLRQANRVFEPLREARNKKQVAPYDNPTFEETIAVIKNCVQAVRLIAELPQGVDYLAKVVPSSMYFLRRQLFVTTAFEQRFEVSMYGKPPPDAIQM